MIDITTYINEGNITNVERKYREFTQLCRGYNCDVNEVSVKKTTKNNWAVYCGDKRICTASRYILDDATVEQYNITLRED